MTRPLKVLAVSEPGLGRRLFLARSAAALAAAGMGLSGCAGAGRGTLNLYNWSNYIAPDTIPRFEKKTGIAVNYDEFSSQDVLFAKLKIGITGYDLVVATDYMLRRLVKHGLLSPLEGLARRDEVTGRFRHPPWDPELEFSVPHLWGTTGVAYNATKVSGKPDSWDLLWDPRYARRITMLDEKRDSIGATLIRLGYSGNSTDPEELAAARRSLEEQKPLLRDYTSDCIDDLARDEIWAALAWSGDANQAHKANEEVRYYLPLEGTFVFVDSWCMPKGAPHPEEAVRFLNYLMQPGVAAEITNHVGYPNAIGASLPMVRKDLLDNPLGYPPQEMLERTVFQEDLGPAEREWDNLWRDLKFGGGP